jgi:hypothetical protein
MSDSGQMLPYSHPTQRSFKRPLHSDNCRTAYACNSANADLRTRRLERPQTVSQLTLKGLT